MVIEKCKMNDKKYNYTKRLLILLKAARSSKHFTNTITTVFVHICIN